MINSLIEFVLQYQFSELEVEKLKREKAKLKLEKEGAYIIPGQRKV
jgi:hypothetical protein